LFVASVTKKIVNEQRRGGEKWLQNFYLFLLFFG
jgi:hypothetical protein